MDIVSEPSIFVRIYIAGDYNDAARVCREWCQRGACVRLSHCDYIYTGGQESGVEVAFINYPRFPAAESELMGKAQNLATELMDRLFQLSCTIEGPTQTIWLSNRPPTNEKPWRDYMREFLEHNPIQCPNCGDSVNGAVEDEITCHMNHSYTKPNN